MKDNMIELEDRQIETPQDVDDWLSKSSLNHPRAHYAGAGAEVVRAVRMGPGPFGNIEHTLSKYDYAEIK